MESTDASIWREQRVLETFAGLKRAIGEDEYHMIHQTLDFARRGLGFQYELRHWFQVDRRFTSRFGAVPFSSQLHEIIEGLIRKGRLLRDPDNPIILRYNEN